MVMGRILVFGGYLSPPPKIAFLGNQQDQDDDEDDDKEEESDPTPDDLEYISQIKRVKFTIAIEDMREVERRKLVGIKYPDVPNREQLAAVLEEVPPFKFLDLDPLLG